MSKIDLNENQLVLEDVKVLYWDGDNKEDADTGYLALIDHRCETFPFRVWKNNLTAKYNHYKIMRTIPYRNVEIIEPKYRIKDFYTFCEIMEQENYKQLGFSFVIENKKIPTVLTLCHLRYCGEYITFDDKNNNFSILCDYGVLVYPKEFIEEVK